MVPVSHILAFAAVVSVVIAIPGPSVLFTISRALTVGRRAALLTVAGNEIGLCVQVVAVAFGVGAVVERSAQILAVVKLAGAAYLVYLGVQAIRHRKSVALALAADEIEFLRWRAERFMKLRYFPRALRHSPRFCLRHGPAMVAHTLSSTSAMTGNSAPRISICACTGQWPGALLVNSGSPTTKNTIDLGLATPTTNPSRMARRGVTGWSRAASASATDLRCLMAWTPR